MIQPDEFETSFPGTLEKAQAIQERIVRQMESFAYSTRDIFASRLAIEEALSNAIRHGNRHDTSKSVHVHCRIDENRLQIVITDQGDGFDPSAVPNPTMDEFIERPSGRGILLMHAYMDVCEYSNGGRRITIERQRNSPLPKMDD